MKGKKLFQLKGVYANNSMTFVLSYTDNIWYFLPWKSSSRSSCNETEHVYGSVLENCIIVRYYLNYCSYTVDRPSVARTLTAILPRMSQTRSWVSGGGLVVRWCWIGIQCRGVLLIWIRVGKEPTVLAAGAGGGCLDTFLSSIRSLIFLPLSGRRPDIDWKTVSKGR